MTQNQLDWIFRAKRLILVVVIVLGMIPAGWAEGPAPLTNLHAICALTNAEARNAQPVAFEATVVYFRGYESVLYVQDGDDAIFVLVSRIPRLLQAIACW